MNAHHTLTRTTWTRLLLLVAVVAATLSLTGPAEASHGAPNHAIVECAGPLAVLERNDDDYTEDPVDIGFPIRFFGATYTQLFVNNNGNVTFDEGRSDYTPDNLYEIDLPIIRSSRTSTHATRPHRR